MDLGTVEVVERSAALVLYRGRGHVSTSARSSIVAPTRHVDRVLVVKPFSIYVPIELAGTSFEATG